MRRRSLTKKQTLQLADEIRRFQLDMLLPGIVLPSRLGIGNGTLGRIMRGIPVDKLTAARVRRAMDGKGGNDGQ